MIVKSIAIFAFILIVVSLGNALFNLVKDKNQEHSAKILKALTFRIGLSVVLFVFVAIALMTGLLEPNGIGMQMHRPIATNTASPAK
jgi:uncharacterized membrane protein